MAHLNPIDHSKLHYKYLGWGVDCRKNKQEWFEDLKHYSGPQLRELDKNDRNVNVIPCSVSISEEEMHSQSRDGNLGGRISGTVPFANLNAAFDIELVAKQATEEKSDYKFVVTKIVTFQDDISRDPGTVSVVSEGHEVQHSYFEEVLCGYILEYVGLKQRESKSQSHDLGKPVKDLRGQTAIARLDDYTKRCQPQLWQLVADACTYFVEKKIQCTHYVCGIKIGAKRLEMKKTRKESVKLRGGVGDGMPDRKVETSRHSEGHEVHTLGNEGNELEVVSVKVKPVSSLVSERSCKLKVVMERLLESYDEIVYGEQSGPYIVSCQDKQGKEIYWHVVEEEIYGTSEATKASEFFIKYLQKEAPQFCIMHKNSSDADFFARFTDKQGSDCLRLVRTATTPDISFVLKSSTKEARNLPAAPTGWAKEGPFFIRKFSDSGSIRWILEKLGFISVPYVGMTKCEEESKSEYRTVRRYKIDDENAHLMMFTMSYQVIKAGDMSCAQDASTAGASYERYAPCLQSASTSTSRAGKEYLALRALDTSGSSVLSSVWGGVGTLVGYLVGLRQQSHVSRASEFSAIVGSPYYSFPQSVTAAGLSSNALRAIQ